MTNTCVRDAGLCYPLHFGECIVFVRLSHANTAPVQQRAGGVGVAPDFARAQPDLSAQFVGPQFLPPRMRENTDVTPLLVGTRGGGGSCVWLPSAATTAEGTVPLGPLKWCGTEGEGAAGECAADRALAGARSRAYRRGDVQGFPLSSSPSQYVSRHATRGAWCGGAQTEGAAWAWPEGWSAWSNIAGDPLRCEREDTQDQSAQATPNAQRCG